MFTPFDENNKPAASQKSVLKNVFVVIGILAVCWLLLFLSPIGLLAVLLLVPILYFGLPIAVIGTVIYLVYKHSQSSKQSKNIVQPQDINSQDQNKIVTR